MNRAPENPSGRLGSVVCRLTQARQLPSPGEHDYGTGFGQISRLAGPSRQIQFWLKLIF